MKSQKIMFTIVLSALIYFGLSSGAPAEGPASRDTALAGGNTADGQLALGSLTTGIYNSAFGIYSLLSLTDASFNTGVGAGTLLVSNGPENTAVGAGALFSNVDGGDNNAVGAFALFNNVSGFFNNAHGRDALLNSTGDQNNAMGDDAMFDNTTGSFNTAVGDDALDQCTTGSSNVAIGDEAGTNVVVGSNIIAIGAGVVGGGPFADLDNTCYIGSIFNEPISDPGTGQAVFVDQFNVLGFNPSTRRVKHDIEPMDKASEALFALTPVTFKYNSDKKGATQFGLIAEEVAEVNPALVLRDKTGQPETVRYEQINAMCSTSSLKSTKNSRHNKRPSPS